MSWANKMESQQHAIQGRLVHHSSQEKQLNNEVLHLPTKEEMGGCSCCSSVTTMEGAGDAKVNVAISTVGCDCGSFRSCWRVGSGVAKAVILGEVAEKSPC